MLDYLILNRRIRTSLIIGFIIFIIIPAMAVGIFSYVQSIKVLEQSVFNSLEYFATAQEEAIDNWGDDRKNFVQGLAENEKIKSMDSDKTVGLLLNALKMDRNFHSLVLVKPDGKIKVDSIYQQKKINATVADREYFKQAMAGITSVSEVLISRNNNKPIIIVATPVKQQEKIVGVLFGAVDIEIITRLVQQNVPGNMSQSYLVDSKGVIINESKFMLNLPQTKLGSAQNSMSLRMDTEAVRNIILGQSGSAIYHNYLGHKVFGIFYWKPELKMGLVVEKDYSVAMLDAGLRTYFNVVLASVIVIFLFIIFGVVYSRRLSQPLERLVTEVNLIAEGSFSSIINIRSNKEVEELAGAINHMSSNLLIKTSQLNDLIQQLQQSREDLNTEKDKLAKLSITDELTGLFNRRYLNHELDRLTNLCSTLSQNISLMILDLDHFKIVNDTYGHATGDIVLKELAELIKSHSRATDVVGRFGGEEFIIIVPFIDGELAKEIAERIRHEVSNFIFDKEEHKLHITVSIGIATIGLAPGESVKEVTEKMLKAADECLYNAKNTGRNRVVHQTLCKDKESCCSKDYGKSLRLG